MPNIQPSENVTPDGTRNTNQYSISNQYIIFNIKKKKEKKECNQFRINDSYSQVKSETGTVF